MYYNRKKYMIKNIIIITFILLIAIFATHAIYYKFENARIVDYSSDSLDIIFHDTNGAEINLIDPSQVTDAIGLSSKAYTLTIKNNLTEPVNYQIKLVDNIDKIVTDDCESIQIPKDLLKVSIKESTIKNNIYLLSELTDEVLLTDEIEALGSKDYTIRIWLDNNTSISLANNLHYHGLVKVIESNEE